MKNNIIFRPVVGYEGLYEVSNTGVVRSVERKDSMDRRRKGKNLYFHYINGYAVVSLSREGTQKNAKIHRLVAQAFIPNPEGKPCVDHIDTNRSNNAVNNLRWCTYQENSDNPLSSHSQKLAASRIGCRAVSQYDKHGVLLNIYPSASIASQMTGASASSICNCCTGRRKTAKGYKWSYYLQEE